MFWPVFGGPLFLVYIYIYIYIQVAKQVRTVPVRGFGAEEGFDHVSNETQLKVGQLGRRVPFPDHTRDGEREGRLGFSFRFGIFCISLSALAASLANSHLCSSLHSLVSSSDGHRRRAGCARKGRN